MRTARRDDRGGIHTMQLRQRSERSCSAEHMVIRCVRSPSGQGHGRRRGRARDPARPARRPRREQPGTKGRSTAHVQVTGSRPAAERRRARTYHGARRPYIRSASIESQGTADPATAHRRGRPTRPLRHSERRATRRKGDESRRADSYALCGAEGRLRRGVVAGRAPPRCRRSSWREDGPARGPDIQFLDRIPGSSPSRCARSRGALRRRFARARRCMREPQPATRRPTHPAPRIATARALVGASVSMSARRRRARVVWRERCGATRAESARILTPRSPYVQALFTPDARCACAPALGVGARGTGTAGIFGRHVGITLGANRGGLRVPLALSPSARVRR